MPETQAPSPRNATSPTTSSPAGTESSRWQFLSDVLVFQGKLIIDGLRDLLLSPISIIAAIADLLSGGQRPGDNFYSVIAFGKKTEIWINLFGCATRRDRHHEAQEHAEPNVDALVGKLEEAIKRQYERGGITASAKEAIDKTLDNIERKRRPNN